MEFSDLPFTAFLQYSPRGPSEMSRQSRLLTTAVKNDGSFLSKAGPQRAIPYAARRLAEEFAKHPPLQRLFGGNLILVPAPRRAPLVTGGLWPTHRLCQELEQQSPRWSTLPLLLRRTAVRKSATAGPGQRPGPQEHYESLAVDVNRPMLTAAHHLVVVDDVVTRGATFMGCYARLREAYPTVPISCFALIRTVSDGDVDAIMKPVAGVITYQAGGAIHRHP